MKRLLVVLFIVLASPVLVSVNINQHASPSTQMVAYAGKSVAGGAYCTCGDPGCILDPGECDGHNTNSVTVASGRDTTTNNGSIDSGSSVMFLAFALLILFRLGSK